MTHQSAINIMAESVVMNVEGPHHATLFHDLCGRSQLQTCDKLLPEPFLVTENDVGIFFSMLQITSWLLCSLQKKMSATV